MQIVDLQTDGLLMEEDFPRHAEARGRRSGALAGGALDRHTEDSRLERELDEQALERGDVERQDRKLGELEGAVRGRGRGHVGLRNARTFAAAGGRATKLSFSPGRTKC